MQLRKSHVRIVVAGFIVMFAFVLAQAAQEGTGSSSGQQSSASSAQPPQIPSIDGGLGPCSVEITVMRPGGKVVDGAKVTMHIAYGFLNVRRLDLEVPTNAEGKARITGLPNNLKHGLLLHGSKDNLLGTAFVDPAKTCEAKHELVLVEQAPADQDNLEPAASDQGDQKDSGSKDAGTQDSGTKESGNKDKQSQDAPK